MEQSGFKFEAKKSALRGKFFSQQEADFPTYLLVCLESPTDPKPSRVVLDGEYVQYRKLSVEQRKQPIYHVFSLEDDFRVSGYHTFDRDVQKFVDWFNVTEECDWISPEWVPSVKLTVDDVRFAHRDEVYGYYRMNKTIFLSEWKRGLKSLEELDARALEIAPKYDVVKWTHWAKKHENGEVTIVKGSETVEVMQGGESKLSESLSNLTVSELSSRLQVKDSLSLDVYMANYDAHVALGIEGSESAYRLDGINLTRDEMLPLLELEGNSIKLPQDVRFSSDSYRELKRLFVDATGKYYKSSFVFDERSEAVETFNRLLGGETINVKKSLQYYPTTDEASKDFLDGLDFTGMTVFEPSAGEGFLVKKAYELGAKDVLAAEIYSKFHPALADSGATLIGEDLFSVKAEDLIGVDAVLMNPPFTGGLDVKHINYVLSIVPEHVPVYSIMSKAVDSNAKLIYEEFRAYLKSIGVETKEIGSGAFKDSGTNVNSVFVHIPGRTKQSKIAA